MCVFVCDSSWTGCYDLAKKTSAFQVQNERGARGTGVNLSCVSLHSVSGSRPWVQEESGKLAPSDDLALKRARIGPRVSNGEVQSRFFFE